MSLQRADLISRHDAKTGKYRSTVQQRRDAYRLVDIRDGHKCRACGVKVSANDPNPAKRTEHRHIRGRFGKEAERTGNIISICRGCHDLRHVKRTLVITGNADQPLHFSLNGREWFG